MLYACNNIRAWWSYECTRRFATTRHVSLCFSTLSSRAWISVLAFCVNESFPGPRDDGGGAEAGEAEKIKKTENGGYFTFSFHLLYFAEICFFGPASTPCCACVYGTLLSLGSTYIPLNFKWPSIKYRFSPSRHFSYKLRQNKQNRPFSYFLLK